MLGRPGRTLLDPRVAIALVPPEHLERVAGEVQQHAEGGDSQFEHEDYPIVRKDGSRIWLHDCTTILRDRQGRVTHYRLDIHDIWFCLSNQCTRTLRVDDEEGERFEFELSEVDYVDGPSNKVVWQVGTCLDPTMRRDRFYVKTHGCETSDHYVWYNCNVSLNREDLTIVGADSSTGEDRNLKFLDIERIDFP